MKTAEKIAKEHTFKFAAGVQYDALMLKKDINQHAIDHLEAIKKEVEYYKNHSPVAQTIIQVINDQIEKLK